MIRLTRARYSQIFGFLLTSLSADQKEMYCQPLSEGVSVADVRPGRGIPGVLELGKTIAETAKRRSDFLVGTNESGYSGTMVRFGASVQARSREDRIGLINFDVDPAITRNVFSGSIGALEFGHGQRVTRAQVCKLFGDLSKKRTSDGQIARQRLLNREDVAWLSGDDSETLYYQSRGIMFNLKRDVVVRFAVLEIAPLPQLNNEAERRR